MGVLITFEGGEGVGKSTQIKHLKDKLQTENLEIVSTREPGGTPAAEKIRDLLSDPDYGGQWSEDAELMLLFAARAEHIKDVLHPALSTNKIVLCDRYIDSTRVYQGYLGNVPMPLIQTLEEKIVGSMIPHLTFIMDMPAEMAMQRVQERGAVDHYDEASLDFYQKLREGFLDIAKSETRCVVIDATQTETEISEKIYKITKDKLSELV